MILLRKNIYREVVIVVLYYLLYIVYSEGFFIICQTKL